MSTYYVSKPIPDSDLRQWEEVEGRYVSIVAWLDTFFYQDEDQDSDSTDDPSEVYLVVEARSGHPIASAYTKVEAIRYAKYALALRTLHAVRTEVNNAIRKHGLSPRYHELLPGDGTYVG